MSEGTQGDLAGLVFDLTRWDLIRLARDEDPAEYSRRQAARALNQLCEIYRAPVLAYLNRRTRNPEDAEDLAQEFFSERICPGLFLNATAEKGRFRSLLLVSLKNFLRDHIARARTQKRGGDIKFVPFDEVGTPSGHGATYADRCFDACWAATVVERALARLRRTCSARGETPIIEELVPFISDPARGSEIGAVAQRLGVSVNTLNVRLVRLRVLYANCVRQELARTVTSPDEIEPEIRYLLEVLSASS